MSQIYKASASSTPSIPTSFETDFQDTVTTTLGAGAGSAVPQSNTLRLGGDNGIKTYEITQEAGSMTVGFIRNPVTIQTTDATPTTIITQATNTDATMTVQIIVAAFCTTNNDSAGVYGTAVIKNVAGTASVVNTVDLIKNTDATLAAIDVDVTTSGANFLVRVTGVGGLTINWDACLPGVVST